MGCDIYGWIESKEETGHWRQRLKLEASRHYALFGGLAGVRRNDLEIIPPKGKPEDADLYGEDCELGDHSFSWLTTDELKRVKAHLEKHGVYSKELDAWIAAMEQLGDARIVFGFDS